MILIIYLIQNQDLFFRGKPMIYGLKKPFRTIEYEELLRRIQADENSKHFGNPETSERSAERGSAMGREVRSFPDSF